jgi:hypothetical protein
LLLTEARAAIDPMPAARGVARAPGWHPATRVAFRFCFVYLGLYVVMTQMLNAFLNIPGLPTPPDLGVLPPARPLFLWIGRHVLGLAPPAAPITTATGDTVFGWVQAFSLLLVATVATAVWSVVARRRTEHAALHGWFRLFLRMALGATLLFYGVAKVIPQQMPILDLVRLVEPFGNFSPKSVLWASVGAAPAYEIALGGAEVLAGLLLFFPVTTLAGALLGLLDTAMVFLLNMTYDVNVKLFSFHLVLMSLVLLAPNARRLFDLLVLHRAGALRPEPAVGRSASARRAIVVAQALFGVYTLATFVYGGVRAWTAPYGGGGPRSPLFGIWEVDSMVVGGVTKPPLLSDSTRWRRVIFQGPAAATFQRMDDTFRKYVATVDSTARSLALAPADTTNLMAMSGAAEPTADTTRAKSALTYRRVDRAHLLLDGTLDAQDVHLALTFRDPDEFLLRRRGFHWVSEVPFDR